jgi:hypothetical protein
MGHSVWPTFKRNGYRTSRTTLLTLYTGHTSLGGQSIKRKEYQIGTVSQTSVRAPAPCLFPIWSIHMLYGRECAVFWSVASLGAAFKTVCASVPVAVIPRLCDPRLSLPGRVRAPFYRDGFRGAGNASSVLISDAPHLQDYMSIFVVCHVANNQTIPK